MKHTNIASIFGAVAVAAVFALVARPAHAQWAVIDPANLVQNILTQLRAIQSNINEAKQLQRQIEQLQYQIENTKGLTKGDWDVSANSIDRLIDMIEDGDAIAIAGKDFEWQFKEAFPGYEPKKDFSAQYDGWTRTRRDTVFNAMKNSRLQVSGIKSENQALARLRAAARSTTGQKQALDASNQIALAHIDQLQQLRELVAMQTQMAGTQLAAAASEEETKRGSVREALQYHDQSKGWTPKPICAVPPCDK